MKTKPNIDQFQLKKDPTDFLDAGNATEQTIIQTEEPGLEEQSPVQTMSNARVHREQKVFRLPLDLILALKRESYERTVNTGVRVTETELVEQALRGFLNI